MGPRVIYSSIGLWPSRRLATSKALLGTPDVLTHVSEHLQSARLERARTLMPRSPNPGYSYNYMGLSPKPRNILKFLSPKKSITIYLRVERNEGYFSPGREG